LPPGRNNEADCVEERGFAWRNFVAMADEVAAIRHALTMSPDLLSDGLFYLGGPETLRIWDLALRCDKGIGGPSFVE
jgi:hypothetical protein